MSARVTAKVSAGDAMVVVSSALLAWSFLDSHCHVHLRRSQLERDQIVPGIHFCPMSVDEADWQPLIESARREDIAAIGLGIHPWFAHRAAGPWRDNLVRCLRDNPDAIVGEIGLDKAARTPETRKTEWDAQLEVFRVQWEVATQLDRPVSVHCVRAHGFLYDWLRGEQGAPSTHPPAISLHSYTGSADMVRAFTRISGVGSTIYFGFSPVINMKAPNMEDKLRDALRNVPQERILIESDQEEVDMSLVGAMEQLVELISDVKGVTAAEVKELTRRNAASFFRRVL